MLRYALLGCALLFFAMICFDVIRSAVLDLLCYVLLCCALHMQRKLLSYPPGQTGVVSVCTQHIKNTTKNPTKQAQQGNK